MQNMKFKIFNQNEVLDNIILFGGFLLVAIFIGGGLYNLERNINYKFGYQEKVAAQLAPLEQKIFDLEKRISKLEHK